VLSPAPLPVYLIHWDAPEWCASAAASLLGSEGVDVELTVVDNGGSEGTALTDHLPPACRVLPTGANLGYTGGANVALSDWKARYPDAELCLIGSHDLHVLPGTLAALVKAAESHPRAGIVAPALVEPRKVAGGEWRGRRARLVPLQEGDEELVTRDWASGTCLLLRRACVESVGLFDESLGSYVEDVDYGLRAGDQGWDVLVVTTAHARGLGAASPRSLEYITANTVLLNAKRQGRLGAVASVGRFAWMCATSFAASLLPWRARERRAESRLHATHRSAALGRLLRSGRLRRAVSG
jgi:N-acetylglucosaminyl-diphospho-decaprenol L-rhamnosyltransferase